MDEFTKPTDKPSTTLSFGTTESGEIHTIYITKDNLTAMMEKWGAHFIAHGLLDKLI